jgi:uncharacterized protein (DUF1778 family)
MGTLSVHKIASKDRISARVNHDIYQTIVKAAESNSQSINDFVIQAALSQAQDILQRQQLQWITVANDNEALWLAEKMQQPTQVNAKLEAALTQYQQVLQQKCKK